MKIKREKVEQDKEYISNTASTLNKREQQIELVFNIRRQALGCDRSMLVTGYN